MPVDISKLEEAFEEAHGLPHPKWDVVTKALAELGEADSSEAWSQVARQWFQQLGIKLQDAYQVYESEHFQLLSAAPRDQAEVLAAFAEHTRLLILKWLEGIAVDPACRKVPVLVFANENTYYRYIAHYYPEGEFAGSSGIFLSQGCPHIALAPAEQTSLQRAVAHELIHASLQHLPLPSWLEEGVATIIEKTARELAWAPINRELAECHWKWWTQSTIQAFW